ncbi:MAG: SusC/RagA family TonB-linked outer membrane protein, partial [Bacteroidales bacterium]|nr:SusC/RagA family TonB-linked outer membrane protein [Bacteroidales bacterium]
AEKGQKISVKFNTYYGLKKMANAGAIQAMDAENYVKFQYELGSIRGDLNSHYTPYFGSFSDIDLYKGLPTNNWVDAVFGNIGNTFSADASVSGSGDGYNWTIGYAHMGDKAIMSGSDYTRDNLSFKGHFKTGSTTSIDANIRYSTVNVHGSGANGINDTGTTSGNGRLKHAVSYAPIPVKASIQGADEEQDYGDNAPPLLSVADNDSKRIRNTWNANAAFNWEIIDNLKLKVEGGLEDYRQGDDRFYGLTTYYVANNSTVKNTPSTQHKEAFRTRYRNTNTLSYDLSEMLGAKHNLNALLGEELTITKSNTLTDMIDGLPVFYDAAMAWNFMASGIPSSSNNYYSQDDKLLSFFGRVNYDYDHRYSLGATLRTDGSSKFARGHRWGFFPSAAASWTISNESFMDNAHSWLDQLKLRYSFGTAGNNNIPSGQLLKQYSSSTSAWLSMTNNIYTAGKVLNNPALTWETTYPHNIGLDFSLRQSRLSGSVEVYQNDTKDLLINFPISGAGYQTQYRNAGSVRNRGAELTLSAPIVAKEDFGLNISANISYNQNRVTSLAGLPSISACSEWVTTAEISQDYVVEEGQPLGNMYGFEYDGFYTPDDFVGYENGKWILAEGVADDSDIIGGNYLMPGALKLKNTDLSEDNKVTAADMKVIGNAMPDFTGGFSLSGYFKGFDFSANFNYVIGNQIYNANKIEFTSARKYYNRNLIDMMNVDNRWTAVNWETGELYTDLESIAAANAGKTMWNPMIANAVFTNWAVEDGSYLRLQSATIGYTLPEKLTQKVYLKTARVYVTGTNLFCLTKYSGYDPEVDTRRKTPLTPGVDYSAYPKSIGFVAGVNLTF